MRRALLAVLCPVLSVTAVRAQTYDPVVTGNQQQLLQSLLNNAIVAVRQNDEATACNLRGQAMNVLNANLPAFQALYPANNWSDLQVSLAGSLSKCSPQGQPSQPQAVQGQPGSAQ